MSYGECGNSLDYRCHSQMLPLFRIDGTGSAMTIGTWEGTEIYFTVAC